MKQGAPRSVYQHSSFYSLIGLPGLLILIVLFIIPLAILLFNAFVDDAGTVTFQRITSIVTNPYIIRILAFTLFQAFLSTFVSVLVALPGAYLTSNFEFKGKRLIKSLCMVPFVLPSILVVLGFVIFYGNSGMVNRMLIQLFDLNEPPLHILYSFKAIIMAHAFYNIPIAMGLISSYWERLPVSANQAASTLGARGFTTFRTITLPRLTPAIISASTLVFLFCYSSFAIILVLGGGPQFTTMEVEIYREARIMLDTNAAAALSVVSIVIALCFVAVYSYMQNIMSNQEEFTSPLSTRKRMMGLRKPTFAAVFLIIVYSMLLAIFVLGPMIAIVVRSFQAPLTRTSQMEFSLKWYRQLFGFSQSFLFTSAITAILYSTAIAFVTALVSLITSTITSAILCSLKQRGRLLTELLAMMPMAVSSVIIGLGYHIISSRLYGSTSWKMIALVMAHVVIASPLVLRTILPTYRSILPTYMQASMTLGATVSKTFRKIEIPLLRSAMVTGASFAFAISMGELNATLVLSDSHVITIPIVMYRLIGSYNYNAACALGSVLILFYIIIFFIAESIKRKKYA
ncbi:MAG: iron ABC transporter permease [Sphaerochaetaceae bacterium]|nr:iron ABC transporter permease [Sphaerochaetaceae bacterium]MDD3671541.1 iron ABC transporter permease [Sphaerochaetaceae bacterium]MDD4259336.1 iron ABC transporter permease [Sphaerochaetaceae bacterium]MDD4842222.1 iron ABC transporter permease [Sphaerochaetaceae bacterium]NLO60097.1 iron ABC transporter permease [Spirochaetales bacterium]